MTPTSKRLLIAEIGINHDGNFDTAKNLIRSSFDSKVGAVKFQYRSLDRAYALQTFEIGDEILKSEISRTFLSAEKITGLALYAKSLGLQVGISFFDIEDILDFDTKFDFFDFFKVPSVEATNLDLILYLISLGKHVYISTGAHTEEELEACFVNLPVSGWTPLHCVSNYPTLDINAKLGYLKFLANKWKREVGYSSHDANWENCLIALAFGATIIERHITFDKEAKGLDHSTSSTPEEFFRISQYINNFDQITSGNHSRSANQGELINRQNLGKSYFASRDFEINETVLVDDLDFRHPNVGITRYQFKDVAGKPLLRKLSKGRPLTLKHFEPEVRLDEEIISACNNHSISLPVRLHDYLEVSKNFPIKNFELHLSYAEVDSLKDFEPAFEAHSFSIHLPDYQSPTELLNPFSDDIQIRNNANTLLENVATFGEKLLQTQQSIILVSSLSILNSDKETFYKLCKQLQQNFEDRNLKLAFQWLPPFAWYFGGSQSVGVFNDDEDVEYINSLGLNICLDTSHMLMGAEFFSFNPVSSLNKLKKNIIHYHLADARGYDGEGYQLGQGQQEHLPFLLEVLSCPEVKVLEVWQGHLNLYSGFEEALKSILELTRGN